MKIRLCILFLMAALAAGLCGAIAETAETAEDPVIAMVNGEPLLSSVYSVTEDAYLTSYENSGADLSDEAVLAYVQDLALTAAIEEMLVTQDMTAQGCYEFSEETDSWLTEQGTAAYESALADVGEVMRATLELDADADMSSYALAYAQAIGVTAQDYIDFYRTQYAYVNYYAWLLGDDYSITDEDVQAAYEERVAAGQARYENDVAAFETALSAGEELWYKPEGYRSILQILLPAEGDTDEEKLASVQATVDEIEARLEQGEAFESLIAEYGADPAFADESFYGIGYQVHRDSVLWEDAFITAAFEMEQPGDWSQPFASDLGVHILYYLCDSVGGAVELTDTIHEVLAYTLYTERCETLLNARVDELAGSAEVILY